MVIYGETYKYIYTVYISWFSMVSLAPSSLRLAFNRLELKGGKTARFWLKIVDPTTMNGNHSPKPD